MFFLPSVDQALIQCFGLLLLWAAVSDLQSFMIPNRISVAICALYPAYVMSSPVPVDWLSACALTLLVFAVGAFVFARGWFGGGDVKLLTAASLWAGPALFPALIFVTGVAGAAIGLLALAQPLVAPLRAQLGLSWIPELPTTGGTPNQPSMRTNIPYGVAIAVGGLFVAVQLLTT